MTRPPSIDAEELPDAIGPYRVLREIGRGGMGTVYLAERQEGLRQVCAIKVVRRELATPEVLARFDLERRTLATMTHPFIARVFDGGETGRGEPYLVMEYVEGRPINEVCERQRLTLHERVRLIQQVCRGVHHAHLRGVVHRDLKPANVLVVRDGDDWTPRILDFGLAKATHRGAADPLAVDEHHEILGTPEYMSPEQATGDNDLIDALADVYSIGVMLYEVVCGQLPFPRDTFRRDRLREAFRMIREDDPPRPSTRLTAIGTSRAAGADRAEVGLPRGALRAVRGELDWIVMRALAKEPARRYQSAIALAEDLGRFLADEPVLAAPPRSRYRLGKLIRRHRLTALVASAALVLALVASVLLVRAYRNAERMRGEAVAAAAMQRQLAERAEAAAATARSEQARAEQTAARLAGAHRDLLVVAVDVYQAFEAWAREPDHNGSAAAVAEVEAVLRQLDSRVHEATLAGPHAQVTAQPLPEPPGWVHDRWREFQASWQASFGTSQPEIDERADLVPIGRNPDSGLWEFLHLPSQMPPVAPETLRVPAPPPGTDGGLVFVLIPSGPARTVRNEDVELAPYWISKFELTMGQWQRLVGRSFDAPDTVGADHPLAGITWLSGLLALRFLRMDLPTEAQWQHAARGGAADPWPGAAAEGGVRAVANVADASFRQLMDRMAAQGIALPDRTGDQPDDWNDGYECSAPAGSFAPNGFGLHDTAGNVFEWCLDVYTDGAPDDPEPRAGDGLRGRLQLADLDDRRIVRGGAFVNSAAQARLDTWSGEYPYLAGYTGLRPVIACGGDGR
ncbi:MAG: protein kinase [Planctomycetes bacterium]|nr:protein kinase [Planctomycetota bacterium]